MEVIPEAPQALSGIHEHRRGQLSRAVFMDSELGLRPPRNDHGLLPRLRSRTLRGAQRFSVIAEAAQRLSGTHEHRRCQLSRDVFMDPGSACGRPGMTMGLLPRRRSRTLRRPHRFSVIPEAAQALSGIHEHRRGRPSRDVFMDPGSACGRPGMTGECCARRRAGRGRRRGLGGRDRSAPRPRSALRHHRVFFVFGAGVRDARSLGESPQLRGHPGSAAGAVRDS
jgi:hypothetical protein